MAPWEKNEFYYFLKKPIWSIARMFVGLSGHDPVLIVHIPSDQVGFGVIGAILKKLILCLFWTLCFFVSPRPPYEQHTHTPPSSTKLFPFCFFFLPCRIHSVSIPYRQLAERQASRHTATHISFLFFLFCFFFLVCVGGGTCLLLVLKNI